MTDNTQFEQDFEIEATNEAAAAAAPTNEVVEGTVVTTAPPVEEPEGVGEAGEPEADEDDFFTENAAAEVPDVDPAKIVTIIPSSSDNKYVETDGSATPMLELISRAKLQFAGDFQCYLNNAEISLTTLVPAGSTVSIVGKVKGG